MRKDPAKQAAIVAGETTYQGTPCRNGHSGRRYTKSGGCIECGNASSLRYVASPKGKEYRRKWRSQPHVRERERTYAKWFSKQYRYGLTRPEFEVLLARANGECEACGRGFEDGHQRKAACVDHDHETGKVRGLLCQYCNRALGLLKDNIEVLESLADYLKRFRSETPNAQRTESEAALAFRPVG